MKKIHASALSALTSVLFAFAVLVPASHLIGFVGNHPFEDVEPTSLEGAATAFLHSRNIVHGFPDGTFRPLSPVNRAQAAKLILLSRGIEVTPRMNNGRFTDVADDQWYTSFILTAAELGIIEGYPDGSFGPERQVTTAEFLAMLTRAFGLTADFPHAFVDVSSAEWFAPYADIAWQYRLFPERGRSLLPFSALTRKHTAIALYILLSAVSSDDVHGAAPAITEPAIDQQPTVPPPAGPTACGSGGTCTAQRGPDGSCRILSASCGEGTFSQQGECGDSDCRGMCYQCGAPTSPTAPKSCMKEPPAAPDGCSYFCSTDIFGCLSCKLYCDPDSQHVFHDCDFGYTCTVNKPGGVCTTSNPPGCPAGMHSACDGKMCGTMYTCQGKCCRCVDDVPSCIAETKAWEVTVAENKSCTTDNDCMVFEASCPLVTCGVAIKKSGEIAVKAATQSLIGCKQQAGGPTPCAGCAARTASCVQGKCTLSEPPSTITMPPAVPPSQPVPPVGSLSVTKDDTQASSHQLLLGNLTPGVLRLKFSSAGGDIAVTAITIDGGTNSVDRLELYKVGATTPFAAATGGGCGSASMPGRFCALTSNGQLIIPGNGEQTVIVRARMKSVSEGGKSGETVTLSLIEVRAGNGIMNTQITGATHDTVAAAISSITNSHLDPDGTNIPTGIRFIGQFRFTTASHMNGNNSVRIRALVFTVNAQNVQLKTNAFVLVNTVNAGVMANCTADATTGMITVTCNNLDASAVNTVISPGATINLALRGEVTNAKVSPIPSILQVSLTELGNRSTPGTIRWSDGVTEWHWADMTPTTILSVRYQN